MLKLRSTLSLKTYAEAVSQFFAWCERHRLRTLEQISPNRDRDVHRASSGRGSHSEAALGGGAHALRFLGDGTNRSDEPGLVSPGSKVRREARQDSGTHRRTGAHAPRLDQTDSIVGLRDRALIGLMCFTFARVSAMVHMQTEDYYENGKRWWVRLHEKGGKRHEVPCHHNAEAYLDAYLDAAGIRGEKKTPFFRSVDNRRKLTEEPMTRVDVLRMVKRRALQAGLPSSTCCHTFRAYAGLRTMPGGIGMERPSARQSRGSERPCTLSPGIVCCLDYSVLRNASSSSSAV
jgi:integrase/recombinase XerD